jgi:prepilin-type N-terminal cleavage/methylation domain-containing protein
LKFVYSRENLVKKGLCAIEGFTLIELMIVVAIIGILVAVVIPNYQYYVTRGFNAAATSDLINFRSLMTSYFGDQNSYPGF